MPEKNYCKRDRHPCLETTRLSRDEKIWRTLIDCPNICCAFCSKLHSCEFGCWFAREENAYAVHPSKKRKVSCPDQCTLQDKVFSKILEEPRDEFIFI